MPIALLVAQALLQYGPELATGIATMLHSNIEPTLQEWLTLFQQVRTYDQIVAPKPAVAPAA